VVFIVVRVFSSDRLNRREGTILFFRSKVDFVQRFCGNGCFNFEGGFDFLGSERLEQFPFFFLGHLVHF